MNLNISGYTNLLCLLGHPAKHSKSPAMHNEASSILGLDYCYLAFDIEPNEIESAVKALRMFGARGFNLTMPFKETVIPHLDELSKASYLCQSVNTVVNEDGKLYGHTTDGIGYMDSLRDVGFDICGGKMTLLGAGGAAKSILTQAALDGVKEISVFKRKNKTFQDTVDFAKRIEAETKAKIFVFDMADEAEMKEAILHSDLLVNATNVGMEDNQSLVKKELLHKDLFVSDIIYHPPMTQLLLDAKEAGARYLNGEYMLLFQGAAAFELWTGKKMPVEEIKKRCFS
ncbi:MAG: shikimate dehydrogenase [Lachnospiraceae bacterium]|nr:shikimate dehydrogenase [Lachnospiraceae bacterium]